MTVAPSPRESARFGLSIGRVEVGESLDRDVVASIDDFDVVILRAPASANTIAARLATLPCHRAIAADQLYYWEWKASWGTPSGLARTRVADSTSEIEALVRVVFDGYRNHYAANPLLDRRLIAAGYAEWCHDLLSNADATGVILDDDSGRAVGFAVVDWEPDVPDVRLAGMIPEARGRGLYSSVIDGVMHAVGERGRHEFKISTQSDNIGVMRAWARLGLLPASATSTFHIVRTELLER